MGTKGNLSKTCLIYKKKYIEGVAHVLKLFIYTTCISKTESCTWTNINSSSLSIIAKHYGIKTDKEYNK